MAKTTPEDPVFEPSPEDVASVLAWFDDYDELAATAQIERMADLAMFPLNSVTDDAEGNGSASWSDREQYVREMTEVIGDGARMESVRTPHFLSRSLVFVVTDATYTHGGVRHRMRYGDLLVRREGRWYFQTMVQGGWG